MWLVSSYTPSLAIPIPRRVLIALLATAVGFAFVYSGILAFRRAGTTVNPTKPETASAVVASGVYRFSRNPMYVGVLFLLAGWAVFLSHALACLFVPAYVAYMNRFQIVPEERALLSKFGQDYVAYRRSVRRWL